MDMDDFHDEDFQQEDIEKGQESDGWNQQFHGNGSNKGDAFSGSKSVAPGNMGVKRQLFLRVKTVGKIPGFSGPVFIFFWSFLYYSINKVNGTETI
jgi:hypothetical protein